MNFELGTKMLSQFARGLNTETAFDVLAVAKRLKAAGKGAGVERVGIITTGMRTGTP